MQRVGFIDGSEEREEKKQESNKGLAVGSSFYIEQCGTHDFPN